MHRFLIRCLFTGLLLWQGAGPIWAGVTVVGATTRETALKPGGKTHGEITLRNNEGTPAEVRIYATDYQFTADGRSDYGEPGRLARSNASWTTFTPRQITVPANGTASVYYTVQVPQEAGLTGTYWSLLMVEPLAPESLEPPQAEKGRVSMGVRTVIRYAIQIVTHIGDTGTCALKFLGNRATVEENQKVLLVDLENTGERWLRPLAWVELFDASGASLGRFDGNRLRLYPGCSSRFRIDLSKVPKGTYDALVVADNGDDNVFGKQCSVEVP